MQKDETWTSDEYGTSHEGRVAVLPSDGTTPEPVYFDGMSSIGVTVRHWSVYDGSDYPGRPRAHALRAQCACGWTGESHPVEWESAGDRRFFEHGYPTAGQCLDDWDQHIITVGRSTISLPPELLGLLESVTAEVERLAKDSPVAAIKAARELEIIASRTAHWPAHEARAQAPETVAAALGLNANQTRALLARYGGWSPYR